MTLADRIVVLNGGNIEQIGTPMDLYERPANKFVAGFIGSPKMNLIPGRAVRDNGAMHIEIDGRKFAVEDQTFIGEMEVGIRPEHLAVASEGLVPISGTLDLIEPLGEYVLCHVSRDSGEALIAKLPKPPGIGIGEPIELGLDLAQCHYFDTDGKRLGMPSAAP